MKSFVFAALFLSASALSAAEIGRIVVRQQWPWSNLVSVEYELKGVTEPVDVSVSASVGGTAIEAKKLQSALSGRRCALTKGGTYEMAIDPTGLLPEGKTVSDLKVELSAGPSVTGDVLYKIVNLESPYDVEDVTRAQLLNGERGAVVTEFSKIGKGFTTSLDDVVIWTGVTNDVAYKTTHMVFRKIPANGKSFFFCKTCNVSFTNDFYIGVFEVTQTQYKKMRTIPDGKANETNELYAATRPVDRMYYTSGMRGSTLGMLWPQGDHTDVDNNSYMKLLQQRIGLVFDLPTEAMWEFACRAGTTTDLYTGEAASEVAATNIMRAYQINCVNANGYNKAAPQDCDLSDGPNQVGSYAPNAWGLYDMLGNIEERCLDFWGALTSGDKVDPRGATEPSGSSNHRIVRGGCYADRLSTCTAAARSYYGSGDGHRLVGFRVCLYPDFKVKED